jgi:hypothetical protein
MPPDQMGFMVLELRVSFIISQRNISAKFPDVTM